jgi:hypothetical protein
MSERGGPGRSPRGRERRVERGGASAAVGSRHRPVVDGCGRAARAWHYAEQGRLGADERTPIIVSAG